MVFPEIAVQMIEDIPFSEAPERGEKGAFIAIPCQAVQDDIRAQMRDAVPDACSAARYPSSASEPSSLQR